MNIWFTPLLDQLYERDETFVVTLGTPTSTESNYVVLDEANKSTTVTIRGGKVQMDEPTTLVSEGVRASVVWVTTLQTLPSDVVVPFTVTPGTATPDDYEVVPPTASTVTIREGTQGAAIPVRLVDDEEPEGAESFTVTLGEPTAPAGEELPPGLELNDDLKSTVVTIAPSDGAVTGVPAVSAPAAVTAHEPLSASTDDARSASITVSLTRAHTADVVVPFTLTPGTATSADYTAPSPLKVTIPGGSVMATISVPITADTTAEPAETFTVTLGTPTGPNSEPTTVVLHEAHTTTVTISPAVVSLPVYAYLSEGGNSTFGVSLTQRHTADVVVPFTVLPGSATENTLAARTTTTTRTGTTPCRRPCR